MKIQVLFGSQNDARVFNPLVDFLSPLGDVKMTVASAHRDPLKVKEIVTSDQADVYVAGAGLAAHLPGVVASLTSKSVFGVAVNGAFGGLDAFLSIVQMPKDIPVMCITENNIADIYTFLKKVARINGDKIYLNWNKNTPDPVVIEAIQAIEKTTGLSVIWAEVDDEHCYGQILTKKDECKSHGLNLFMLNAEDKHNPSEALNFYSVAQKGGLWVGLNNVQNFSLQLLKLKKIKN